MKELNTNNSKKLIIGVSILFCAVILIIGATTAYFTQSGIGETGNVVSTDQVTLHYDDNDDYMLGELIPINEKDLVTAYNNKCKDNKGYNVCSIYQFTITNTGNVVQDIIINMHPKANGFTNLKFNLYDITNNVPLISNESLTLNSETLIPLVNDLTLDTNNNKSNTYELVFYIKNDPYNDQTDLDAGKRFGANIEVNSVTTGTYILEELGDPGCWKADENDSTIISEFIGYTDKNGNEKFDENDELKKECEYYFKKDTDNYYIVNIPSVYAGYNFTTVGNNLFNAIEGLDEEGNLILNKYGNIKNITINNKITTIENGSEENFELAFGGNGGNITEEDVFLTVNLPNNLTHLGDYSFTFSKINSINLPSNLNYIGKQTFAETSLSSITIPASVTTIGDDAFGYNEFLTSLTFEGALDGNSKLESIGENAFDSCDLDYQTKSNPLIIPTNVKSIGSYAFKAILGNDMNKKLKYILYIGNNENILNNKGFTDEEGVYNEWYHPHHTNLLTSLDQMTED